MKKRYRKYHKICTLVLLIIVLIGAVVIFNQKNVPLQPEKIQQPDQIGDFSSAEAGTLSGTLQEHYFKEQIDPVVVLFASARIPGLSILYYPEKKIMVGGSPALVATDISLFDGHKHVLMYSFKREGEQALVYDGAMVAWGKFKVADNSITGLVTGTAENSISEGFEKVEVR